MFGILTALGAGAVTWQMTERSAANLPPSTAHALSLGLLICAVVAGYLAGSAAVRRATHRLDHSALFGALAFAVAGGAVGALFGLALSAGYLSAYASMPAGIGPRVLLLLSYPAFAALGCVLGALAAAPFGLLAAGAGRLVSPRQR